MIPCDPSTGRPLDQISVEGQHWLSLAIVERDAMCMLTSGYLGIYMYYVVFCSRLEKQIQMVVHTWIYLKEMHVSS